MQPMVSVMLSFDEKLRQWAAWVPDVAAYGCGSTMEGAVADLKKALLLYIEEVGRDRFLEDVAPPSQSISIPLGSLV